MRTSVLVSIAVAIVLSVVYLYFGGATGFGESSRATSPQGARRAPDVALPNPKLPGPKPELSPEAVVQAVMEALQRNDAPWTDSGIETAFNFASPSNKEVTGPLERFIPMVKDPAYASLINPVSIQYSPVTTEGDRAVMVVTVVARAGETMFFRFDLSRQTTWPYGGCWMTDGVMRVQSPDLPQQPEVPEEASPPKMPDRIPV